MRLDNVVVRPQRRLVEYYVDLANWHRLSPEASVQLVGGLAGLPSEIRDDGEEAKRFDLLILRMQLGLLVPDARFNRHRTEVQEIASALLEQTTIPMIQQRAQLLDEVAGDEWWQDVTLPLLELAWRRMRDLVRLVPKARRTLVFTNFADEIDQARRSSEGLGLFIRSLVGLDREVARDAFSEFLVGRTLNAAQLDFINLIVNDLTVNGVMEPGRLYESPFNGVAPRGPEALFSNPDADRMVSILRSIKNNAILASEVA
jgi:type I site-specific restriction endonuclease